MDRRRPAAAGLLRSAPWGALIALLFVLAAGGRGLPGAPAAEVCAATGATYYVDAAGGDDANSGLSPERAWRTLDKVSGFAYAPGDTILLRRGSAWREELTIPSSGAEGAPITIGAYGSGAAPLIDGSDIVVGWSGGGDNVWAAALPRSAYQVFFDRQRGFRAPSLAELDSPLEWHYASGTLYIYSAGDPDGVYRTPGIEATVHNCVSGWGKSHLVVRDLALRRGKYGLYFGNGTANAQCVGVEAAFCHYDGLMADGAATSGVTFQDCTAHDNLRHGANAHDSSNFTVSGGQYYNQLSLYGNGVGFDGVQGGAARGVSAHDNYYGIKTSNGASGITIEGCTVSNNVSFGIDLDSVTTNSTVVQNQVSGNGSHGIAVEWQSSDCTVARNFCRANGAGRAGIHVDWSSRVTVAYNIVMDEAMGVRFYRSDQSGAYNNVAYGTAQAAYGAVGECSEIVLKNNIADACADLVVQVDPGAQSGFASDHNDWNAGGQAFRWGWDRYGFAGWQGVTGQDTHSLSEDPRFSGVGQDGFGLLPGSPCIDAGVDVGQSVDYAGAEVPQGEAVDIGAREHAGSDPPPAQWTLQVQSAPIAGVLIDGTPAGETDYSAQLDDGSAVTLTAPAIATGDALRYGFVNWALDGAAQPAGETTLSFAIGQDSTAEALYERVAWTIEASSGPNGAIDPQGSVRVLEGDDQAFTMQPDAGFQVLDVLVDGASVGPVADYTFRAVYADHTIHVEFAEANANEPPVADAGPDQTAAAGQQVRFSGAGSYDPDGQIVLFEWDLDGDGAWDAAGQEAYRTYAAPGERTVTLRVTDDAGATATDTCLVSILPAIHVADISLELSIKGPWVAVDGEVTVHDQDGKPVDGVTVEATWSVNGAAWANGVEVTNRRGIAHFRFRSRDTSSGSVIELSVDDLIAEGYVYVPELNAEDSAQVVVP